MSNTFLLEILTPDRSFYSDDVDMLIFETPDGQMGVLKNHIPMVVAVAIGPIRILKDGQWIEAVLSEGFLEVKQDKAVILCDSAEWPDEIDANRAKTAEERARERLQNQLSQVEYQRSQSALQRALTRLKVSKQKK